MISREEIAKNDYNISPSRYIHTSEGEEFRPIAEIIEELEAIDEDALAVNAALRSFLSRVVA